MQVHRNELCTSLFSRSCCTPTRWTLHIAHRMNTLLLAFSLDCGTTIESKLTFLPLPRPRHLLLEEREVDRVLLVVYY